MNKKIGLTAIASSLILAGCSTTATEKADETIKKIEGQTKDILESNQLHNGSVYSIDKKGIYVDKTPMDTFSFASVKKLPSSFNKKIVVNDQQQKTKEELASFLSKITGMPVMMQQDLLSSSNSTASGPRQQSVQDSGEAIVNEILYTGTVRGFFDHIASKLNAYWKYEDGYVEIYKYETKMFTLDALNGINKLSANLNTQNSSSASSESGGSSTNTATSGQNTEINNTVNVWEEVGKSIQAILSDKEKISLTPSAGKIIVQATPSNMRKVENVLKQYNDFYSRLVRLDVKVYQVEIKDKDAYGINWNTFWKNAAENLNLNVELGGTLTNNVARISSQLGTTNKLTTANATYEALSTLGKVSILRNNSVVTLNNQPVPLNVAREVAYVQSTSVSTTDSSSSTEINPGVVTEGFAMNLTPLVNDRGEVLLQYSVDASTIEDIETFESADHKNSVQLPRRSISNFLQKVSIRNGESMVLTGFQEVRGSRSDSGVGSASNWWLGGKRESDNVLKTIVVVITPYVLK